jgi:hypothetical protein
MSERIHAVMTAVSWIPSDAVSGPAATATFATVGHHDDPLPDRIDGADATAQRRTLERWRADDRFRFANQLAAWVDVEDGSIVAAGYAGDGLIGGTRLALGARGVTFAATPMPLLQAAPERGSGPRGDWARLVQTWGGRTGVPMPRRVNRPPFVQYRAPLAWSTLALTVHADGHVDREVVGASSFPRHWIYDDTGALAAKTGTTDYKRWYRTAFGRNSPWGRADSAAFVAAAESALERHLSTMIMRAGDKPRVRRVKPGTLVTEQGDVAAELYLVLDGVLAVEVDGAVVAEVGPGAVVGERAGLEGGKRTATLRALTPCRVAAADPTVLGADVLGELGAQHRREAGRQGEAEPDSVGRAARRPTG